jgi:hypothetical protein
VSDPATIRIFLHRLRERRVVPVGPREHLAAERLLRSRTDWPEADLRATLASLLSGSEEEWSAVAAEYDASFHPERLAERLAQPERPTVRTEQQPQQVRLEQIRETTRLGRALARLKSVAGRVWGRVCNARRGWWIAAVALLNATLVVVVISMLPPPEQTIGPAGGGPQPVGQRSDEPTGTVIKTLRPAETREISVPLSPSPETIDTLAAIVGICLILTALGIRLIRLPDVVAAARRRRADKRRTAARKQRERLEEQQAASRESLQIRYHVPHWPALSRQAILDSAELLGRLLREERGDQMAPLATLDRTLAAGGRFTPVRPRHVRQEVLLLVDVEQGDHPWLPGFLRVVDAWHRQGVRLIRYDFQMNPAVLVDPDTREGTRIAAVARRTEGLPLVIFSRGLRPGSRTGEAGWLRALIHWRVRAWLDPDPQPLAGRTPLRRREIDALTRRHGLGRFPLSDPGVVTMARWLAADGESLRAVDWADGLAPDWTHGDPRIEEALRKWALAAALVPDPSWDQLESIRRHFPEIHRALGDRRDLQRLLEWVAHRTGADVELHGGRCLNIPERDLDRWIREQRKIAQQDSAQRGFEAGVRRLLLAQLEPAMPSEDQALEHQRWRLKLDAHRAVIGEGSARELLGWAFDAAVAHEASRWVRRELDRQANGLSVTGFDRSDIEALGDLDVSAEGVAIPELVMGHPRAWLPAALALLPALLVLAYDPARAPFDGIARLLQSKTARVEARLPPVYALEQSAGDWVTLAGGSFLMGSKGGDSDERPVHRVQIGPFAMGRTEVTVAEYRRCVEAKACDRPETPYNSCNWGKADRDRHPTHISQRFVTC